VKRKPKAPSLGARLMARALQNPGRMLATVILGGCGGYIAWNALALQTAHHPAPLFNPAAPSQAAAPQTAQPMPPARPAAAPPETQSAFAPEPLQAPVAAPAAPAAAPAAPKLPSRSAIADLIRSDGQPGAIAQPAARSAAPQVLAPPVPAARAPTVRDPIGEIIRMGGPVPTPPANVGSSDLVLSGQRALAKLGYGIKADGIMGPGTRQAIERFEQDRKLPVTGEFNTRTVRELSAASGIAVQ